MQGIISFYFFFFFNSKQLSSWWRWRYLNEDDFLSTNGLLINILQSTTDVQLDTVHHHDDDEQQQPFF